ncbi:hypothetical protein [Micromonospora sp. NPDC023737]|uniref:hypothetical protein n=1 Tax=unclassified Micromonospora TaxID=2617518 RepID=UPI0033D8FD02
MSMPSGGGGRSRLRHALRGLNVRRRPFDSPARRWTAALLLLVLAGAAGVVASSGFGRATAGQAPQLVGRPVPAGEARMVAAAALSCPALTPARLAGQLMAASGFDADARTSVGTGLAGLSDASWERWKPTVVAHRADHAANITALAHLTCDLVGQVRQAGIEGDAWLLALGAYHSGIAAVREAGGVPAPARQYVDTVAGYAAWYARQPLSGSETLSTANGPAGVAPNRDTPARPVPSDYLAAVSEAGGHCPALSPARVAAQLMASSGFNPNLLGVDGGQGIAQFTPEHWARYAPFAATASPWDPGAAVPALAHTMCSLVRELAGVGKDPYLTALAAFRAGPEAVRQAGGVPDNPAVRDYLNLVSTYVGYYGADAPLAGKSSARTPRTPTVTRTPQSPRPDATRPGSGSPTRPSTTRPSPTRSATTSKPPKKPDWQTRVVNATSVLRPGGSWRTNRLTLTLTSDGNVVLYDQGRRVWSAQTSGKGADQLVFQADGNLVLYTRGMATIWSTRTDGHDGAILVLQNDGNVTISQNGRTLWQTGTAKAG